MVLPIPSEMTATVGQILTAAEWNSNVRDGINFLANRPLFVGSQTTAQSIANATTVAVALDTTTVDTYSGHSNTVNNSRYTAQVAGTYLLIGSVGFASSSTGVRIIQFGVNGTLETISQQRTLSTGLDSLTTSALISLGVGDYVSVFVFQNSTAALALRGDGSTSLQVIWMHA